MGSKARAARVLDLLVDLDDAGDALTQGLTRCETARIWLADVATQAEAVATGIAEHPRPHLKRLELRQEGFDRADEIPRVPALSNAAFDKLLAALPNLEALVLEGHAVARVIRHAKLRELELVGMPLLGSFCDEPAHLPSLESLTWTLGTDAYGVCVGTDLLAALFAADALPSLVHLDLGDCELDGDLTEDNAFVAGDLLKQLKTLALPQHADLPDREAFAHLRAAPATPGPRPPADPDSIAPFVYAERAYLAYDLPKDKHVKDLVRALETSGTSFHAVSIKAFDFSPAKFGIFARALAAHEPLRSLSLTSPFTYGLEAAHLAELADAFAGNRGLEHLNLAGNRFREAGWPHVTRLIAATTLRDLNIAGRGDQTDSDRNDLVGALRASASLRALKGGLYDAASWAELISHSDSLRRAVLPRLDAEGVETVAAALAGNQTLEEMTVNFPASSLSVLARAVAASGLVDVHLGGYNSFDMVGAEIGDALGQMLGGRLRKLTLEGRMDAICVDALNAQLEALESLDVSELELDGAGLERLCQALGKRSPSEVVGLPNRDCSESAVRSFCPPSLERLGKVPIDTASDVLAQLPALRSLDLSGKYPAEVPLGPMFDAAAAHPRLESLAVRGRSFKKDATAVPALARLLEKNRLRELNVRWCGIMPADYKQLAPALANATSLRQLSIFDYELKPAIRRKLAALAETRADLVID